MSTKCLVTKLKGVVNDDSLDKFGVFRFSYRGAELPADGWISWGQGVKKLHFLDSGFNEVGELALDASGVGNLNAIVNSEAVRAVTNGYVEIREKYEISRVALQFFYHPNANLNELKYNGGLFTINGYMMRGNLDYYGATLTSLRVDNSTYGAPSAGNIEGNLSVFNGNNGFNANSNFVLINTNVKGDISNLGNAIGLPSIYLANNGGITGTIESLASAQFANGRTSGNLNITLGSSVLKENVTYGGRRVTSCKVTFSSSGYEVGSIVYAE